jgi:hypothetical protein
MQDQEIWKIARQSIVTAIAECSRHAGQSSQVAVELLEEGIETLRSFMPERPRMLGEVLGEYLFQSAVAGNRHKHPRPDAISALVVGGANVDWRNGDGKTALQHAVINKSEDMIRILNGHGADLNATFEETNKHVTPLIYAIQEQRPHIVNLLLELGALPDAEDPEFGMTALRQAVSRRHSGLPPSQQQRFGDDTLSLVKTLVEYGAEPSRVNSHNQSTMRESIHDASWDEATIYLIVCRNWSAEELNQSLARAAHYDKSEVIKALVAAGADPCATFEGRTLIEEARGASGETVALINSLISEKQIREEVKVADGEPGNTLPSKGGFSPL